MRAIALIGLLAAGCPTPDSASPDSDSWGAGPGDSVDSGDSGVPPPGWPPYAREPDWQSEDWGYATGGAWADIDGDGALDWVVAYGNDMQPGPLAVHYGGDGALSELADWTSEGEAYHGHIAAGDVDGDGFTDVVTALFIGPMGFDSPGGVALYLNEGGELPDNPSWQTSQELYCFSLALGDIDNDGDLDLAAATGEPYYHEPEPDLLWLNQDGWFEDPPAWRSAEPSHSMDVAFLDLDQDGALDLAFARDDGPHALYLNQGSGLDAGLPETQPSWEAEGDRFEGNTIDFGDVDGDGWLDLVISDNMQRGGPGTIGLYRGPELERIWESADEPTHQSAVALADLDDDGDLDLAAGAWWGGLRLYRNEGAEGLRVLPSYTSANDIPVMEAFAFHDLDGAAAVEHALAGDGPLISLPRPCQVISASAAGAVGDGWFSTPSDEPVELICRGTREPDIAITDWNPGRGNLIFQHLGATP
jgi:hypothetical protein